jgi:ABC-type Fe3+-siderophore transport system permease subunit
MELEGQFARWLGGAFVHFLTAFVFMGIVYLIGWRKSHKWRARFWWITFGLAGIIGLITSGSLVSFVVFGGIVVLIFFWPKPKISH